MKCRQCKYVTKKILLPGDIYNNIHLIILEGIPKLVLSKRAKTSLSLLRMVQMNPQPPQELRLTYLLDIGETILMSLFRIFVNCDACLHPSQLSVWNACVTQCYSHFGVQGFILQDWRTGPVVIMSLSCWNTLLHSRGIPLRGDFGFQHSESRPLVVWLITSSHRQLPSI